MPRLPHVKTWSAAERLHLNRSHTARGDTTAGTDGRSMCPRLAEPHPTQKVDWMHHTMTHLCLGISANDLQVPGRHEEALLLFLGCLVQQGGQEHAQVKIQRPRPPLMHKASKKYQGWAFESHQMWDQQFEQTARKGEKKYLLLSMN